MKTQAKPRVAFFDFACCEGCQLEVLSLEEQLLEMIELVDIVTWREAMSEKSDDYDIAFCEGSITREADIERIKHIRETADILVSLGACATIGCHNALKNQFSMDEVLHIVYGDRAEWFDTISARPITAVVPVDYQVNGCPASLPEFVTVFKHILMGKEYKPPNQPVCVECKLKDNLCVYEKGMLCLGPVTRCGCDAICTSYGHACFGCRGLVDDPNLNAAQDVLAKYGLSVEEIVGKFRVYNNWPELSLEESHSDG